MKVFLGLSLLVAVAMAEPPVHRQQAPNARNRYYFARQEVETPAEPEAAPYQPSGWKPDGPAFELPQKQQAAKPEQQYGAPQQPQQQYGAPQQPQQQYGAPPAPQRQQAKPQQQYGAPAAPQQQYGAPAAPQQQYGAPAAPQQQYGAPEAAAAPQAEVQQPFGARLQKQRGFVPFQRQTAAPATPQQQYGAPQQQYGAPPQQQYGPPATTTEEATDSEESTTVPTAFESQAEPVDSVNELDEEGEVDEQQKQKQTGQYYVALPDGRLQRVQYISSQDLEAMKYFARIQAENVEPLRGPIYAYSPLQKLEFAPAGLQVAVADPYAPATPVVALQDSPRPATKAAKPAPEKIQQQQPLAAPVRYQTSAAVVGLTADNGAPLATYAANFGANNEQRYFITF